MLTQVLKFAALRCICVVLQCLPLLGSPYGVEHCVLKPVFTSGTTANGVVAKVW